MACSYTPCNRDQLFLLPPSMREWLPDNHLVWFVIDVVRVIDTRALHARYASQGPGRCAYDPEMMLSLLIYGYCSGVRSSRQIERLCRTDLAYRVICAEQMPDHGTIARFRAAQEQVFKTIFVEVLRLVAQAGLASLGTVAIDGTKMGACASLRANREASAVEAEVERILDQAAKADEVEQSQGHELLPELSRSDSRLARLRKAAAEVEATRATQAAELAQHRAQAETAAAEGRKLRGARPKQPTVALARAEVEAELARARAQARSARRAELEERAAAQGRRVGGRRPALESRRGQELARAQAALEAARKAAAEAEPAKLQVNLSDPQSRVMKTPLGYIQGYNAQAAVNEHQIVLAGDLTQEANDVHQLLPMMAAVRRTAVAAGIEDEIGMVLVDAGYWSEKNLTAPGPDRLIAADKDWKQRQAGREPDLIIEPSPASTSPMAAMAQRMRTAEAASLYALRSQTVEPVFGQAKENRGYRRFLRQGLVAAKSEWDLILASHNLRKLFRHRAGCPALASSASPTA